MRVVRMATKRVEATSLEDAGEEGVVGTVGTVQVRVVE
jgi:hypothetical protein